MDRPALLPDNLSRQLSIFATMLLIIFMLETVVMYLLPLLLPNVHGHLENFADAFILATLSGPFVWFVIARPLRKAAMNEFTRTNVTLENIVDVVINFDAKGIIQSLNPAAESMFGYAPLEIIGQHITLIIPDMEGVGDTLSPDVNTAKPGKRVQVVTETVGCPKDGPCFPVELSISKLRLDGQSVCIAIMHDITERKGMNALLTEQKEFVESLLQHCAVPIFVLNPEHRVLVWNRACEELTGTKAETMLGKDEPWKAFYDHERPVLADIIINGELEQTYLHYGTFSRSDFIPEGLQAEGWYENLNDRDRYIFFNAAPIRNGAGELLAVVETLEDITERKQYEIQLEYQANHDALTSLPNRNLLNDRLRQALLIAQRNQQEVAVIFVDLDHFKVINDSLGHNIGDHLLKTVANRLAGCVRAGDTVSRQGGDEFAIIISNQEVAKHVDQIARKIQQAISQPFKTGEHELVVTCSIGISIFPKDGENMQTLMKNADAAMYKAKEQGRNNFQFYTEEMNSRSLARMTMEKHLRRAVERNELVLHYQPKVDLRTGHITSLEALVRWQSPELGMISPGNFIPLAEDTGLIEPIGEWVLRTACAQNRAWQDAGLTPLTVAVNLSARQFILKDITTIIGQVLLETGLDPRYLELEVTESVVMQNVDNVTAILNKLKGMGMLLAMDDFGTGYSSLSHLKRLPFDKLKIDQSFVRDITSDPDSAAIAKTVIAMAHSLHLKVIAEGVETEEQLRYLRFHDCDEMQGYYFSRPVPAAEFEEMLREDRHLQLATEKEDGAKKTVLVVDDEEDVVAVLKDLLLHEGYHVLAANSAAEGFKLLANNRVCVVISDQRMPGMMGTEFLRRVKELHPATVRMIMSGYADVDSVTAAINQGFVYKFITKPWKADILCESVGEAFRYHAALNGKGQSAQVRP